MEPLDGNSIAGPLLHYFGQEMTTARGSCARCGTPARIAEFQVYGRMPGAVARCRHCGNVVIVLVEARSELRVNLSGFQMAPSSFPGDAPTAPRR